MPSNFAKARQRIEVLASHALDADQQTYAVYLEQATRWARAEWIRTESMKYRGRRAKSDLDGLVRHQDFLLGQTEAPLTRKKVLEVVAAAGEDPLLIEQAFILVMAWGFRPNSYGPYRTSVMLSGARGGRPAADLLADLSRILNSGDDDAAMRAYSAMKHQLEMCGPAFGTKWLYFASPGSARAPILDAVVAEWLARHEVETGSRPISAATWKNSDYRSYLDFCRRAATDIGFADVGLVEYLMFTDQQYFEYSSQEGNFPDWIRRVSR